MKRLIEPIEENEIGAMPEERIHVVLYVEIFPANVVADICSSTELTVQLSNIIPLSPGEVPIKDIEPTPPPVPVELIFELTLIP